MATRAPMLAALLAGAVSAGAAEANDWRARSATPFIELFPRLDREAWHVSRHVQPDEWFRIAWDPGKVTLPEPGILRIGLSPGGDAAGKDFVSGEIQRRHFTGYGLYEVVVEPARAHGLVTAFFVYTGPVFGDTHEEVDIEFLGRKPGEIYVNHFSDGRPVSGEFVELGFEATDGPHLYGFEWQEDFVAWYAEGREIHRVTAADGPIPKPPAKLYLSLWAGGEGQRNWSGVADPEGTKGAARFHCVSFRPPGSDAPRCAEAFPPFLRGMEATQ